MSSSSMSSWPRRRGVMIRLVVAAVATLLFGEAVVPAHAQSYTEPYSSDEVAARRDQLIHEKDTYKAPASQVAALRELDKTEQEILRVQHGLANARDTDRD